MSDAFDRLHEAVRELRLSIYNALIARIWWGIAVWQVIAIIYAALVVHAIIYTLAGGA
jgi:hypothetical protein